MIDYFHLEIVHTLANDDASLLGTGIPRRAGVRPPPRWRWLWSLWPGASRTTPSGHLKVGVEGLETGRLDSAREHLAAVAPAPAADCRLHCLLAGLGGVPAPKPCRGGAHAGAGLAHAAGDAAGRARRTAGRARAYRAARLERGARRPGAGARRGAAAAAGGRSEAARALEGAGDLVAAAVRFQAVYYSYPLGDEVQDASKAIARLEKELGREYPAARPQARLRAGPDPGREKANWCVPRAEYQGMIELLGGVAREQARVRVGRLPVPTEEDGGGGQLPQHAEGGDPGGRSRAPALAGGGVSAAGAGGSDDGRDE